MVEFLNTVTLCFGVAGLKNNSAIISNVISLADFILLHKLTSFVVFLFRFVLR